MSKHFGDNDADEAVSMLYTAGTDVEVHKFPDVSTCKQWSEEVEQIKFVISHINKIEDEDSQDERYSVWLLRVETFRAHWGDMHVPADIKRAVHSVQSGMGISHTIYGNGKTD